MVQPSLLPSSPSIRQSTCTVVFLDMCRCYALQQYCVDAERPETLSPVGFNVDYSFYRRKFTAEVTVLLNQQEENKLQDNWVKEPFRAATIRLFSERSGDDWWIIPVSFFKQIFTNKCISKCFYRHCDVWVLTSFSFDLDWPRVLQPPAKNTSLGYAHL